MLHENIDRKSETKPASERSFCVVFAVVFCIIALWPIASGGSIRLWACAVAIALAGVAWWRPTLMALPNRLWMALGNLLHKMVAPLALGVVFFAVVTPLGLLMRLCGKRPLHLNRDPGAPTYWIPRQPPGPPPGSLNNPF